MIVSCGDCLTSQVAFFDRITLKLIYKAPMPIISTSYNLAMSEPDLNYLQVFVSGMKTADMIQHQVDSDGINNFQITRSVYENTSLVRENKKISVSSDYGYLVTKSS